MVYGYLLAAALCLMGAKKVKLGNLDEKMVQRMGMILTAGFLLAALSEVLGGTENGIIKIARSKPGEGSQEKEFLIDAGEEFENYPVKLEIQERKLTKLQKQNYLNQAKEELNQIVPGNNPSLEQVTEPLCIPQYLQEGAVEAVYSFSDYDVFRADGKLEQNVEEPELVEITAELTCQEEVCLYQFYVRAVPREQSDQEVFVEKLTSIVEAQNQQEDREYVNLPEEQDGTKVVWKEDVQNPGVIIVFMSAAVVLGLFFREKENKKRQEAERKKQMLLDYSGIVSKLSLLLGAGMNISLAWERIALDYRQKLENGETEPRFAYEELLGTLYEIKDGVGELKAYENFGIRCRLGVYRKLSSLIVQNVRRGAKGMQKLLEQEEWEAYEQRKAHARQAGEEAGTKLLLPMGIMLVIVLAILVIPAGMTLNM